MIKIVCIKRCKNCKYWEAHCKGRAIFARIGTAPFSVNSSTYSQSRVLSACWLQEALRSSQCTCRPPCPSWILTNKGRVLTVLTKEKQVLPWDLPQLEDGPRHLLSWNIRNLNQGNKNRYGTNWENGLLGMLISWLSLPSPSINCEHWIEHHKIRLVHWHWPLNWQVL